MKIAYFDCFSGASGNMIVGALINSGIDSKDFQKEIDKLGLAGFTLGFEKSKKKGIAGTHFSVDVKEDQPHRNLSDILTIIKNSSLKNSIKKQSESIFRRLAEAEAKIHDTTPEKIHFHEVGAVDSIIDIVGAVIGLDILGVQEVRVSRLHVGTGTVQCAHGTLPVPAPATLELLQDTPVYSTGIQSELVTPTGAAILTTLSQRFGEMPSMQIQTIGYGLGSRDLEIPNFLRLAVGETYEGIETDTVQLMETNIDDMNPQFYDHIMETLFSKGALDVFLTPIIMKKNRPGVVLSVLVSPDKVSELSQVIFQETTTLGIRLSEIKKRKILPRKIQEIKTEWGVVRVKVRSVPGMKQVCSPEYDDCKKIAKEYMIPIQVVYQEVKRKAEEDV